MSRDESRRVQSNRKEQIKKMNNQNIIAKISVFIAMLVGSLWLGSYAGRMMISYQLFDVDMNLMSYVNEQNIKGILITIIPAINSTFILYIVFIISFTVFLISSDLKLKNNGWLFIISVIIYLTLPFEAYLMTIDYKIISEIIFSDIINSNYVLELIKDRVTELSSFPIIIFLSYCSMYYFILFKPFTLKIDED